MKYNNIFLAILVGGQGQRIKNLLDITTPKQFIKCIYNATLGNITMFQNTVLRHKYFLKKGIKLIISSNIIYYDEIVKEIEELKVLFDINYVIICEPCSKNTTGAVLSVSHYVNNVFGSESKILFVPSDHDINGQLIYVANIEEALLSCSDKILFFGIDPLHKEENFGYIIANNDSDKMSFGEKFVEKPKILPEINCSKSCYFWNSGIFMIYTKKLLSIAKQYCFNDNDLSEKSLKYCTNLLDKDHHILLNGTYFNQLESISIDYKLWSQLSTFHVFKAEFRWQDCQVGDWFIGSVKKIMNIDCNFTSHLS